MSTTPALLEDFYVDDDSFSTKPIIEKLSTKKPKTYKVVCISLYFPDIARLDSLVAELKRRGHTKANKSQVIRAALDQIDLDKVPKAH